MAKPDFEAFLGRFNIGTIFALGGNSTLKYATRKPNDNENESEYAIKKIRRFRAFPSHSVEMEVEIMQNLNHENMVNLVDFYLSQRHLYIVMDYIPGRNLYYYIEWSIKFPQADIAKVMYGISSALTYLHSLEIIHRDINPRNIMLIVSENYRVEDVKVIDFGCATYIHYPTVFQAALQYSAPELLHGQHYNCNVDVWSLGVVLCYMIFGLEVGTFDFTHNALNFNFNRRAIPNWFTNSLLIKDLVKGMLDKNNNTRFSSEHVLTHEWLNTRSLE